MTLEYLETDFYKVKGKTVGLSGEAKTLASVVRRRGGRARRRADEGDQDAGGKPVKKPMFVVPGHQPGVLPEARLHAGEHRRRRLQRRRPVADQQGSYLAAAGSIVQVEARHAASIALLTGAKITPNGAFDKPLSKAAVLKAAGPLIKK